MATTKTVYTGSSLSTCRSLSLALPERYAVSSEFSRNKETQLFEVQVTLGRGATGRYGAEAFFQRMDDFIAGFTARKVGRRAVEAQEGDEVPVAAE